VLATASVAVSGYRLDDRGSIPAEAKDFSSNFCVQASSEAHLASCTMGTGGPLQRINRGRSVTLTTSRMNRSYISLGERRYSSYSFSTSALDGLESIWKEAIVAYFKVLSRHVPGGTEKNHEALQSVGL
jgi:hypothetical protein